MKVYEYEQFGLNHLSLAERDEPRPCAREVVVEFHAASLNYRDVLFYRGVYNQHARFPAVPLSDGAGEVVAVGEVVTRWKVGERVCTIYYPDWLEGANVTHISPVAGRRRTGRRPARIRRVPRRRARRNTRTPLLRGGARGAEVHGGRLALRQGRHRV